MNTIDETLKSLGRYLLYVDTAKVTFNDGSMIDGEYFVFMNREECLSFLQQVAGQGTIYTPVDTWPTMQGKA